MTTNNEAFEKWYHQYIDNGYSAQAFEVNMFEAWQAATTEANKRIAELESDNKIYAECNAELKADADKWMERAISEHIKYTELQAINHDLREALALCNFDGSVFDKEVRFEYQEKVRKARLATPAESLQAHDNEVIEKCAKVVDRFIKQEHEDGNSATALMLVQDYIRAFKQK